MLVLIVIAMLSLGAYSFTNLMLAHHEAAVVTGRQAQARSLVDSGVTTVQLFLSQAEADRNSLGGIFDNSQHFRGIAVLSDDDPNLRGCFSIVSPNMDSEGNLNAVRHGLEDESSRLNLNVLLILDQQSPGAGRTLLMGLPGMTEDVADSILDWLDADDTPRELGCEVEYYSGLSPPYAPKNGPVDTVEELLLVRGVTPQLLFGCDINRNGQLDQNELLEENTGAASSDPSAFRGWSAYLTLYSVEWNINPEGNPKVYLNTNDLNQLSDDLAAAGLSQDQINFIIAYRQVGPSGGGGGGGAGGGAGAAGGAGGGAGGPGGAAGGQGGAGNAGGGAAGGGAGGGGQAPGGAGGGAGGGPGNTGPGAPAGASAANTGNTTGVTNNQATGQLNMDLQPKTPIGSILDLIGAQVQYSFVGGTGPTTLNSPFTEQNVGNYLPQLMDYVTVNPAATVPGRINVNQASPTVLSGIPGMTSDIVSKITAQRTVDMTSADPARRYETWLLTEGVVTLPQMKVLMPFITGGGSVYRCQVVGYFQGGQASSRAEVVFDATSPLPRIVLWRDLTHLGRGYTLDTLGLNYSK